MIYVKYESKAFSNRLLLFRGEVILDIECLPNLLGGLPLDHVGHSLACYIEQSLGEENDYYSSYLNK